MITKRQIVVITVTGDRPEAFSLCRRFVLGQTVMPDKWIVVDDGKTPLPKILTAGCLYVRRNPKKDDDKHTERQNTRIALSYVDKNDMVFHMEDDDWYATDWIDRMLSEWGSADLVGQNITLNYHIPTRMYEYCSGYSYACMNQTAYRGNALVAAKELAETKNRLGERGGRLDRDIWFRNDIKKHLFASPLNMVGIKGLPGRKGFSYAWRPWESPEKFQQDDKDMKYLFGIIGKDIDLYKGFVEHG